MYFIDMIGNNTIMIFKDFIIRKFFILVFSLSNYKMYVLPNFEKFNPSTIFFEIFFKEDCLHLRG